MDAEAARLQRTEALFHAALDLPAEAREGFLSRQCIDDPSLIDDVLSLIAAEEKIENFVPAPELEPEDGWIGRQIGTFHILQRIGRGGMGVVYLGERRGAFRQTAAIKLMSFDLLEREAQERFLRERDVLATLEHRNIVRLIDGCVTEENHPYLAMEYIRGRRIDEVCDDPATSSHLILALFLDACSAVTYVHRNLLLHRDLKPANILVTDEGLVKLLDFGTFKSLRQTDRSLTRAGMQALTVRYASPEQLQSQSVSTASDVFSLGMMLYRLLLGRLPERWDNLTIGRYLEALQKEDCGPIAELLRRNRRMDTHLADDVEAIIHQALRFHPNDRYQDVDTFAADLRDAMAGRSVSATRPGRADRVLRLIRRNRITTSLAAVTFLLCIAGTASLIAGGQRMRAEQAHAERGLSDESKLAHFLLVDYFEELKGIPESTDAQRQAISQALTYVDKLPPGVEQFQTDRLQAYTEMGSLLGNPYENNLGDTTGAVRELQKAVDLGRDLAAKNPQDRHEGQLYADASLALGRVYFGTGKPLNAERYLKAAAEENRQLVAEDPKIGPATLAAAASSVDGLGDVYDLDGAVSLHKPTEAVRAYKEAQALDLRGLTLDPACARCRRGIALEYWKIGMILPNPHEAATSFEAGLRTLDAFSPADHATARVQRMRTLIVQKLGIAYLSTQRLEEGLHMLNEVRSGLQKTAASDPTDSRAHFDLYALDFNVAEYLDVMGPAETALELDREILREAEILQHLDPENAPAKEHSAEAKLRLGRTEIRFGDAASGTELVRDAEKSLSTMARSSDAGPELLQATADAEIALHGDGVFAVECATRAIKSSPDPTTNQLMTLAQAQVLAGNLSEARRVAAKVHSESNKDDPTTKVEDDMAKSLTLASSLNEASRAIWSSAVPQKGMQLSSR